MPNPEAVGSAAYLTELSTLRAAMASATAEEKELARWWGSNSVLRWHEIAREIAANYNVPGEVAYVSAKAEEHKKSRLWAGANVQSDLSVGDSLGRIVAQYVIDEWAKKDRMSMANNQAGFQAQRDDAATRGFTTQWHSLDVPSRPPMLPGFGNVRCWNLDDATKIAIGPPAPHNPAL